MIEFVDKLVERVASEAIEEIERVTLDAGVSLGVAAQVCRDVAAELRSRADQFDDEAEAERGGGV